MANEKIRNIRRWVRQQQRHLNKIDFGALQLAQVGGALERILETLIGLVDPYRPLHRDTLRSSQYIARFAPEPDSAGGDGATQIWLK